VPIFIIYAMNLMVMTSDRTREQFTYVLLSFALGGLLGDVFFHTIPHMGGSHDHHGHDHHGHDHHGHDHHGHDHSHGHEGGHGHAHSEEDMQIYLVLILGIWVFFLIEKLTHIYFGGGHDHSHGHAEKKPTGKKVDDSLSGNPSKEDQEKEIRYKSFAVISMMGDFIHNFTDGLSIGVSYVADFKMGLATTAAMFFHEIPHEVGDFAILFQLKYSLC
jgi:zinc transporter ZupT